MCAGFSSICHDGLPGGALNLDNFFCRVELSLPPGFFFLHLLLLLFSLQQKGVLFSFDDLQTALLLTKSVSVVLLFLLRVVWDLYSKMTLMVKLTTRVYVTGLLGSKRFICICFLISSPLLAPAIVFPLVVLLEVAPAVVFRNISA